MNTIVILVISLWSADENVIPYGKLNILPELQIMSYGSLGGRVSSGSSPADQRREEVLLSPCWDSANGVCAGVTEVQS